MTDLIIIRHGNTFGPNDTPTRVGGRTDLPLVKSGIEQAKALGTYFADKNIIPDLVFSSDLQRTQQTALQILKTMTLDKSVTPLSIFNEIDYGPDENKIEQEVIDRVGKKALEDWDREGIVPDGWDFNPEQAIQDWYDFSNNMNKEYNGQTIFIITSNGIARFAPHITGQFENIAQKTKIKLKTGSYGVLSFSLNTWDLKEWGIRP